MLSNHLCQMGDMKSSWRGAFEIGDCCCKCFLVCRYTPASVLIWDLYRIKQELTQLCLWWSLNCREDSLIFYLSCYTYIYFICQCLPQSHISPHVSLSDVSSADNFYHFPFVQMKPLDHQVAISTFPNDVNSAGHIRIATSRQFFSR